MRALKMDAGNGWLRCTYYLLCYFVCMCVCVYMHIYSGMLNRLMRVAVYCIFSAILQRTGKFFIIIQIMEAGMVTFLQDSSESVRKKRDDSSVS